MVNYEKIVLNGQLLNDAKHVFFEEKNLVLLALKYGISDGIYFILDSYINEKYHVSYREFKKYYLSFRDFCMGNYNNVENALYYSEHLANKEEFLEFRKIIDDIFSKAKENDFNLEKINISYSKNVLKAFIFKEYKVSYNKFKKYYLSFKSFLAKTNSLDDVKRAFSYYNTMSDNEEKKLFIMRLNEILNDFRNLGINKKELINYLKRNNLTLGDLENIINNYNKDKQLVGLFYGLFEEEFKMVKEVKWDIAKMEDIANSFGYSRKQLESFCNGYLVYIMHCYPFNRAKINLTNKYTLAIEEILREKDKEKVFKIFRENKITNIEITNYVVAKNPYLTHEEKRKLSKVLLKKYHDYLEWFKLKRKIDIDGYFKEFILSGYTILDYCKLKGITLETFKSNALLIKNRDLFLIVKERLDNYLREIKLEKKEYFEKRCRLFMEYLKNGIWDNGEYREFDLIDYYTLFGDLNLKCGFIYPFYVSDEDKANVNAFFSIVKPSVQYSLENLRKMEREFDGKKDHNGYLIKNTGVIVTGEELEAIGKYLKVRNIPVTEVVLNIAIKRYLKGNLFENTLQL